MSEKHNGKIFETFEASFVVLRIASVKLPFTKSPLAAMFLNQFCQKSIGFLLLVISMTVQSLNIIGQSNVDLEHKQALKMCGGHLGNKMVNVKKFFFQKLSPLTLKQTQKT